MQLNSQIISRRAAAFGLAAVLSASLVAGGLVTSAQAQRAPSTAPITKGQTYVMATHSFNVFIGPGRNGDPGPLQRLADEAGLSGHRNLAVQMIGGSTPMQHWNQGAGDDSKNIAKVALGKGGVDVFTMSPNATMPEPGIDMFGDLVIKTNPGARILVQSSWSAWDGNGSTPSVGGTGNTSFTNDGHDKANVTMIDGWLTSLQAKDGYMARMRGQLEGINRRAGRQIAYVVPASFAVYNLRKQIIEGYVPGLARQSELFADAMGHPKTPLNHVVTYTWFATMYRKSPVGLKALVDPADPTSAARERVLQQIAWNAVVNEPMSGVRGPLVALR